MSVMATSRPASTRFDSRRHTCWRCGIEHGGREPMCIDCRDVEHPEPCSRGHERTEGNIYVARNGKSQCSACTRTATNIKRGWEWSCQACGRRADQGEVLCRGCGEG